MADIFISYSKSDHALALKLSAFLESEGWTVWWDKSLGAADHYRDEITKQLAAARAVITIWSPNSIKSDWVRAEAGRAKADGKLIPVKTPDVAYADIPLPFGEMHTENVGSTDLIRAAIVAQLAKPAVQQSPFWQITGLFKYQILTWIGIIGTAITLFTTLKDALDLADWARELVAHWHEWTELFWGRVFSLVKVKVPKDFVPLISFTVFTAMLVVGANLAERAATESVQPHHHTRMGVKVLPFSAGVVIYLVTFVLGAAVVWAIEEFGPEGEDGGELLGMYTIMGWAIIFPAGYLLYVGKQQRLFSLVASLLFVTMGGCLLFVPLWRQQLPTAFAGLSILVLFQLYWMAAILFSPIQQLTRRLAWVVVGVATLVLLSEISKLDLNQYLKPAKISEISSPTHNLPSHAAA
jgi:hypothetical protein